MEDHYVSIEKCVTDNQSDVKDTNGDMDDHSVTIETDETPTRSVIIETTKMEDDCISIKKCEREHQSDDKDTNAEMNDPSVTIETYSKFVAIETAKEIETNSSAIKTVKTGDQSISIETREKMDIHSVAMGMMTDDQYFTIAMDKLKGNS